jgi:hypothetical protein
MMRNLVIMTVQLKMEAKKRERRMSRPGVVDCSKAKMRLELPELARRVGKSKAAMRSGG